MYQMKGIDNHQPTAPYELTVGDTTVVITCIALSFLALGVGTYFAVSGSGTTFTRVITGVAGGVGFVVFITGGCLFVACRKSEQNKEEATETTIPKTVDNQGNTQNTSTIELPDTETAKPPETEITQQTTPPQNGTNLFRASYLDWNEDAKTDPDPSQQKLRIPTDDELNQSMKAYFLGSKKPDDEDDV